MSIQLCLALLALFSLTVAASDPGCEDLIKPMDDENKIYGKWIYYAGASDSETQTELIKFAASSWIEILPISGSDDYMFHYADRIDGKCYYGVGNGTFTGNGIKLTYSLRSVYYEFVGKHLETCPDCHIWFEESELKGEDKKAQNIFLFTKTGQIDSSNLEDFKKQLKCLNISGEIYFPETTNLCPDEEEGAGEGTTD